MSITSNPCWLSPCKVRAGGGFDFLWKQVHDEGRKKIEETGEQWLMDDQMEMHMERQTDAQTGAQTGGPEQAGIRREEQTHKQVHKQAVRNKRASAERREGGGVAWPRKLF